MKERIETDSLGKVSVPSDKYYGAQTQRSKDNFHIGSEKMPMEVIRSFAMIKKAAALANFDLKGLSLEKKDLISEVCDEILEGKLDEHFPLSVWQTGSGTQTHMNVNEVISNRAIEKCGGKLGSKAPIHPNDDVNKSQSSNDTFPTAMHVCATVLINTKLLPSLRSFLQALQKKQKQFSEVIKVGRTHLMDATPLSMGQEFSGYAAQIEHVLKVMGDALTDLSEIALGATAVGTGINCPKGFDRLVAKHLTEITGFLFIPAKNKFRALSSKGAILQLSAVLRLLACEMIKIANDIRLASSGPRAGIAELVLPANEPGSSIMPGKVNPTQCEAMTMVCAQVLGNDQSIAFASSQGNFQLNVYMPMMIFNLVQSIHLLSDALSNFQEKCLNGIQVNQKQVDEHLERSLMTATILNREIGYDAASRIVKKAFEEDISLKQAAKELGILNEKRFDEMVDFKKMIHPSDE